MGTHITRKQLERIALGLEVSRPSEVRSAGELLGRCLEAADRALRMRAGLDRTQPAPPRTERAPAPAGAVCSECGEAIEEGAGPHECKSGGC